MVFLWPIVFYLHLLCFFFKMSGINQNMSIVKFLAVASEIMRFHELNLPISEC